MARRHHYKRYAKEAPELNITTFLNLMVVLVPFLLITAVFSRITILELNLPTGAGDASKINKPKMTVEVIVSDFKDSGTLKKISVNVQWIDRRGHEKQFMLTTVRSQYSNSITKNSLHNMGRIVMNSGEEGGGGS